MRMNRSFLTLLAAAGIITGLTLTAGAHNHETKDKKDKDKAGYAEKKEGEKKKEEKNIVETAVAAGSFKTLATALTEAGLVETLSTGGPYTVFAPTDEAFAKLPAGTVEGLLKDKEALKKVLLHHVVAGKVLAADAIKLDGQAAESLNKTKLDIKVVDGKVTVGGATVTTADVKASNGVIHVIDTVIVPTAE